MSQSPDREGQIVEALLGLPPEQRGPYLEQACAGDPQLRQLVLAMLKAHEQGAALLDRNLGLEPQAGVAPSLTSGEKAGDRIGRYKLLQQIGEGGCGVVYMAEQETPVRRRVALKVIKVGMDTKSVVARFEAERQALALMDHPNIAKVLDAAATEGGRPYFVMELVRGRKITQYCDEQRFSTRQRLDLFVQVCRAVQHAHQKGVIHRDLKPSNILVTERDAVPVPKVIDFGIAKATGDLQLTDKTLFTAFEQFIGTPAYMSPEQARLGELDIDTRSDIYSLGVLLYELLTGQPPFDAAQLKHLAIDEVLKTVREKDPPLPSSRLTAMTDEQRTTVARTRQVEPSALPNLLRGDLDSIVMKCLEKDRVRRYETANGLANDVQRFLANEAIVARRPSKLYRLQKSIRRNRLLFGAGAAVFIALLAGFLVSTSQFIQKSRAYARVVTAEAEQRRLLRETQQARAEQGRLRENAEARAYTADMGLALQAWEEGNMQRAQELLSAYVPGPTEQDLRGFEWRYLWKLCQDESSYSFTNFSSDVRSLALSPDGRFLAAGGNQKVAMLEIATRREVADLPPSGWANSVDFSPTATNILATGGGEGIVDLWDISTGEIVGTLSGYPNAISRAAFSPDGKKLAIAGWGTTLQLWDVERKVNLWTANAMLPIETVLFTTDGASLISGGGAIGNPLVWDVGTGKKLASLPPQHRALAFSLALSPDGKNLATGGVDSSVIVWDLSARRPLITMLGHIGPVLSLTFAQDGKHLASGGADHTVRVWDLLSGKQTRLLRGHRGPVNVVVFAPDGGSIFSASEDGSVKVWNLNLEPTTRTLGPPGKYLSALALSPDGRFLAAVDYVDSSTRLWDMASGLAIASLADSPKSPLSVAFSPSGDVLAVGGNEHTITLWRVATRQPIEVLTNNFPAGSLAFSPDSRILAVGGLTLNASRVPDSLAFWDLESRQRLNRLSETITNVTVVAFDGRGRLVAVGDLKGTVQVWDFMQQKLIAEFHEHERSVTHLAFSSDDKQLASAGDDRIAVLYDLSSRTAFKLARHTVGVSCVAFAPDNKTLASSSADGTINLWNIPTRQVALTLKGHVGPVSGFVFSRKGDVMASCGADGVVRLWPADNSQR
jgi:WD40 repeat protein/serine/threonine protein kinase